MHVLHRYTGKKWNKNVRKRSTTHERIKLKGGNTKILNIFSFNLVFLRVLLFFIIIFFVFFFFGGEGGFRHIFFSSSLFQKFLAIASERTSEQTRSLEKVESETRPTAVTNKHTHTHVCHTPLMEFSILNWCKAKKSRQFKPQQHYMCLNRCYNRIAQKYTCITFERISFFPSIYLSLSFFVLSLSLQAKTPSSLMVVVVDIFSFVVIFHSSHIFLRVYVYVRAEIMMANSNSKVFEFFFCHCSGCYCL